LENIGVNKMAGALRKVLKIFTFPVFVGLWIVGWSLYAIGDNEQLLKKDQKILIIEKNVIKNPLKN